MTRLEQLLEDYLDYLEIEKDRSPKTRDAYERYLKRFLAWTGAQTPEDITEEMVRKFRIRLAREDIKKVTQGYYVIGLRNFLKYLIKRGITVLPPERIELPQMKRRDIDVLEYEELSRLLDAPSDESLRGLRDRAMLEVLFSTGLRVSELCALNRDIDIARGEFSVRGKGDKLRVVFLSPRAKETLTAYLHKRPDIEEALFVSLTKTGTIIGRITPRAVQRMVDRHARRAGIPKTVHPHQLRHQFATDLLMNGADLRAVQELLGHANVSTTQVYTHLTNKALKDVHEAFHGRRRNTK